LEKIPGKKKKKTPEPMGGGTMAGRNRRACAQLYPPELGRNVGESARQILAARSKNPPPGVVFIVMIAHSETRVSSREASPKPGEEFPQRGPRRENTPPGSDAVAKVK